MYIYRYYISENKHYLLLGIQYRQRFIAPQGKSTDTEHNRNLSQTETVLKKR